MLWLFSATRLPAQTDFLWLEDGAGGVAGNGYTVDLILVNDNPLGGFQFVLTYDTSIVSVDSVMALERLADVDVYFSHPVPGELSVLVTSLSGAAVASGVGAALRFEMSVGPGALPGASILGLRAVVFADPAGNTIPAAAVDGYFVIEGANVLRLGNGYGLNPVKLYNEVGLAGVQFSLSYNAAVFSLDTVFTAARSEHMTLSYNEPVPGQLIALLYSAVNDSIPAGMGNILVVKFDNVQDSSSTINPLGLQEVVLTRPVGATVVAQSIAGYYFILALSPASSQTIVGDGAVDFPGTNVSLDFSFTNQTGEDLIVVSEIQTAPGGELPAGVDLAVPKYWVINHFGSGTFSVDMTLTLGSGAISARDQAQSVNLKLLRRDDDSTGPWTASADGASATDSTVTFAGITGFSEFTIGLSSAPLANTTSATNVAATSATLNGSVNANDLSTTVWFEWGATAAYGIINTADQSPITGTSDVAVSASIPGLSPGTEYHYQTVAANASGTTQGNDQTFTTAVDLTGPVITGVATSANPTSGSPVTVSADVADISGVQEVTLHYLPGGQLTFTPVAMPLQSGTTYSGMIPISAVTPSGVQYFIVSTDSLTNASNTDTSSIPVAYSAGTLTTAITGSAFASGFPYDKWRLISLPGDIDDKSAVATFQDELGESPSDDGWILFKYTGPDDDYYRATTTFAAGESYFLKQVVSKQAVVFELGSGKAYDLAGLGITVPSKQWKFVSAPYPFAVAANTDQDIFDGPYTYGAFGSGGQEGWSIGQVQTSFQPWGGYIVYNNTDQNQTLTMSPAGLGKSLLAKTDESISGWLVTLKAEGAFYYDGGNVVGRLADALDGLDRFDHPEPPVMEYYLSIVAKNPAWPDGSIQTADVRSQNNGDGTWDLEMLMKGEPGPVILDYATSGDQPEAVVLLDLLTRKRVNISAGETAQPITRYSERFPYRLKLFAGSTSYVEAAIKGSLASLPTDFALLPNYPNPFNPSTTISYAVPRPAKVSVKIYNLLGQEVITMFNDWQDMGLHEIVWDGRDQAGMHMASGLYFTILQSKGIAKTRRMVLLK